MLLDAKKLLNGEKTDRVKVVDEKRAVGVVKKNAAMKVRRKKTKLELSGEGSGPKKKLQKVCSLSFPFRVVLNSI